MKFLLSLRSSVMWFAIMDTWRVSEQKTRGIITNQLPFHALGTRGHVTARGLASCPLAARGQRDVSARAVLVMVRIYE